MQQSTKNAISNMEQWVNDPHLKLELEGNLGRGDSCYDCGGDGVAECVECDGTNEVVCDGCDGNGSVGGNYSDTRVDCDDCDGVGWIPCSCDDGTVDCDCPDATDTDTACKGFILNRLSQKAHDAITFSKFYHDGSVDSEFTFTIPLRKLHHVPEIIRAWNTLGEHIGGGVDINGAGMHTAILMGRDYHRSDRLMWNEAGIQNFQTQVEKLLPALYFLATDNHRTRPLNYRAPRVFGGRNAIAVYGNCIEYRLFDPCYDNPERIYEIVEIISKTFRFYANPTKKIRSKQMQFFFYDNNQSVQRFYQTPEQLDYMERVLKHIKPDGKDLRQLKKERGMNISVNKLKTEYEKRHARYKSEFESYKKRRDTQKQEMLETLEKRLQDERVAYVLQDMYGAPSIPRLKQKFVDNNAWPDMTFEEFVRDREQNDSRGVSVQIGGAA